MTSLLRRLTSSSRLTRSHYEAEFQTVDLCTSEKPYRITEIYYLIVVLFIGLPVWFFTCPTSRYSLPEPDSVLLSPSLHVDISVVRLFSNDHNSEKLDYLRSRLHEELGYVNVSKVTYNVDWRVRRATKEEDRLAKAATSIPEFERGLQELHKHSYRFRLLIFLMDKPLCDTSREYSFGLEPFVYLCSTDNYVEVIGTLRRALEETYFKSANFQQVQRILPGRTNLLVTFSLQHSFSLADRFHDVYHSRVKTKYVELPEIVNIRFITQNLFDLSNNVDDNKLDDFFRSFRSRVDEPLEDGVHHVAVITSESSTLLETPDMHFVFKIRDDDSMIRGLRSIVRRVIGLESTKTLNISSSDNNESFFAKWELDVLINALTAAKLESIYSSLSSLSKLRHVSRLVVTRARDAQEQAFKSLSSIEERKPLEAYRQASAAYELAEKAHFDPTLVDSKYDFPDENNIKILMDELELFTVYVHQTGTRNEPHEGTQAFDKFTNMVSARIIKGRILELEHSNIVGPAVKFKTVVNYERTLDPGSYLSVSFAPQDGYLN